VNFLSEVASHGILVIAIGAGGRVVKFIGDGCLAMFSAEEATAAVNAAVELLRAVDELAEAANIGVKLGANVHLTTVVAGYFGAEGQYFDVIGRGVNQTFLLGRGPGIRLSEPVYRKLPSAARSAWRRWRLLRASKGTSCFAAFSGFMVASRSDSTRVRSAGPLPSSFRAAFCPGAPHWSRRSAAWRSPSPVPMARA
jgi:hypothetical protein